MCHNPDAPNQTPRETLLLSASSFLALSQPDDSAYQALINLLLDEMAAAPDTHPYTGAFATLAGGESEDMDAQQERVRSIVGLLP